MTISRSTSVLMAGFVFAATTAFADMPADTPCIAGSTVMVSDGSLDAALGAMSGDTMVTLVGQDGLEFALSAEQFAALPQYAIATENEYFDGLNCYQGPLGRDVMAIIGATAGQTVQLTAINDYMVQAPVEHLIDYDVVFATEMNGARLSVRDKGPIWVVYPQSDNDELRDPLYSTYMVWQLIKVELN